MFNVKIKGPDGTVATLTPEQFKLVERIIVSMMNREITRQMAEVKIASALQGCRWSL